MDNLDQELGGLPLPTKNVGVDVKESLDSEGLPVPKKKVGTSKSSDLTSQSTSDIGWKNKIKEIKSNLGTSEPTTRFNEPTMQKYVPTSPELAEAVGVEPKKELYQTQNPELAKAIGTEPIKQKQTLVIGKETPI